MLLRSLCLLLPMLLCVPTPALDPLTAPPPGERLSLDEAIRLALEHNDSVRRSRIAGRIAEHRLEATRGNYKPLLTVSDTARYTETRSVDRISIGGQDFGTGNIFEDDSFTNDAAAVLSKRWTSGLESSVIGTLAYDKDADPPAAVEWNTSVPLTAKRRAQIREEVENAELFAAQRRNDTVVTAEDIRFAVISSYYAVLQASEQLGIVTDFLAQSRYILDYNENMLSGGFVSQLQVDESRIETDRRRADLIRTSDSYRSRVESLNVLAGLPVEASYVLAEDLTPEENQRALDAWITETLATNLALVNIDKSLQMQVNSLEVTKRLDDVDLRAGTVARRTEDGEELVALELTLSWPVIDGGVTEQLTQAAQADMRATRIARWSLERQLVQQVRDDYRRLASEWELIGILQRSVELAERNIDIARENYEAGRLPYRNYVDIQLDLANSRNALVDAQVSYRIALARLQSRIHPSPWDAVR